MELDTILMVDIPLLVVPFSLTPSKLDLVLKRLCLEDATVCQTVSATFRAQTVRAIHAQHINPSNRFILCLGEGIWSRRYLGDEYITHFGNFSSDSLASPTYGVSRMLFSRYPPPITITKRTIDTFMRSLGDLQLELAHHRVNAHATSSLKIASIEFYVSDSYAACATSLATLNCATVLRDVFSSAHKTLRFLSVCCYGQSSTPACKYMRLQLETINEALSDRRQNFPVLREVILPSEFMSDLMTNRTARRLAKTLEILDMTLCSNLAALLAKAGAATVTEYVVYERVHTLRIRDGYYKSNFHGIDLYGHHHALTPVKAATYQSLPNLRHVVVQRCMRSNAALQSPPPPPLAADSPPRSQLQIIFGPNYETFYTRRRAGVDLVVPTIRKCDFIASSYGGIVDPRSINLPREVTALSRQMTIDTLITARSQQILSSATTTTTLSLTTANRIEYVKIFAPLHDLHCHYSSCSSSPLDARDVVIKAKRPRFTVRVELSPHRVHHDEVVEWLNLFHLQCTCKQQPYLQQLLQREQTAAALAAAATVAAEVAPPIVVQHQEEAPTVNEQPPASAAVGGRKTMNSTGRRRRNEAECEAKSKKLAAKSETNLQSSPYALPPEYSSAGQPCQLQILQLHIKTPAVTIQTPATLANYRKQILASILSALAGLPSSSACAVSSSNSARTDSRTFGAHSSRTGARGKSTRRLKVEQIDLNGAACTPGDDLADPLLHVRHIRLQCCVIIASPSFCSMPAIASPDETSYYCSETDSMHDCLPERRYRTEDDDETTTSDKSTLPYLLFELISAKFRREHVAPLVRLIARRFVRLRHFTIICDNVHSSRKVTYNLDDVVLEERVAANESSIYAKFL